MLSTESDVCRALLTKRNHHENWRKRAALFVRRMGGDERRFPSPLALCGGGAFRPKPPARRVCRARIRGVPAYPPRARQRNSPERGKSSSRAHEGFAGMEGHRALSGFGTEGHGRPAFLHGTGGVLRQRKSPERGKPSSRAVSHIDQASPPDAGASGGRLFRAGRGGERRLVSGSPEPSGIRCRCGPRWGRRGCRFRSRPPWERPSRPPSCRRLRRGPGPCPAACRVRPGRRP